MLRGPGQKAADPFQFVSTKAADEMAEHAKSTLHLAQQQKMQRDKFLQKQQTTKFDDSEPWQADLDTWRRKRKEKIIETKNDELNAYTPRKNINVLRIKITGDSAKDEILHINSNSSREPVNSPRQHSESTSSPRSSDDLNNDSGIDNRTVGSPSTSEFSPRSADLFVSPKSVDDEEPPHHPPPPPPVEDEKLDQVLVPINYKKPDYSTSYTPIYKNREPKDYYDRRSLLRSDDGEPQSYIETSKYIEKSSYTPMASARVEATFRQPTREGVKPFVSKTAIETNKEKNENIDVTVELNREQKATITATKYPRSNEFVAEPNVEPTLRHQNAPSRIYHAVDIPFDETYFPPLRQTHTSDGMFTMNIEMGSQPVHKGLGFAATRKDDGRLVVDSVIVGSPADKAGLLVGDTIVSINGEDMVDKYQSAISRILHDAARVGEADVLILRAPITRKPPTHTNTTTTTLHQKPPPTPASGTNFDKARSVFIENKSFDSYAEFKRKHSRASRDSTVSSTRSSRDYNSLPRGTAPIVERKRDASLSSYRTARESFATPRSSFRSTDDYKVTTYHEKSNPGKLADFVPEIDRRHRNLDEKNVDAPPRTIRNYHVSTENVAKTNMNYEGRRDGEQESASAILKRSTLPRSGANWRNDYSDDEVPPTPIEKAHTPLRSALKKTNHQETRRYHSTESLIRRQYQYSSSDDEENVESFYASMRRQQRGDDVNMVGMYDDTARSRSVSNTRRMRDARADISPVTHRFYDRDGNHVRAPRERSTDIAIQREYGRSQQDLNREIYRYSELKELEERMRQERRAFIEQESRDWREMINQQRQPAPGYQHDRRGIAATSASLSNLPTYINRRMEKERQNGVTEKYERDEYNRVEERTFPVPSERSTKKTSERIETQTKEETVVAVSGKHKCAHCNEELGRGAAMIVESLNLYYHLACFKCYVCKTSLGSGATGADVRVRDGRLHCQTCYSNDRIILCMDVPTLFRSPNGTMSKKFRIKTIRDELEPTANDTEHMKEPSNDSSNTNSNTDTNTTSRSDAAKIPVLAVGTYHRKEPAPILAAAALQVPTTSKTQKGVRLDENLKGVADRQ
ncbi:unnamed protein product [Caenorhabditis bovis]|uniref:Uncharacterized protein n=1 Tax=Caenorhabditis bovis TaxID=2654633 RepID=A0A8S1EU48_9PELO|nr:unnamed protein product [Caenorhabditis bovis]